MGPRIHLAPTNSVAARGAANQQTNISTYLFQWLLNMVGSHFRTDNLNIDDAIKMLAKDLNEMSKTSSDLTMVSIRVNYEALSGHLTRPPEVFETQGAA